MNILATPLRYLDIAFLAFDITGDGEIEAKVSTLEFRAFVEKFNNLYKLKKFNTYKIILSFDFRNFLRS